MFCMILHAFRIPKRWKSNCVSQECKWLLPRLNYVCVHKPLCSSFAHGNLKCTFNWKRINFRADKEEN